MISVPLKWRRCILEIVMREILCIYKYNTDSHEKYLTKPTSNFTVPTNLLFGPCTAQSREYLERRILHENLPLFIAAPGHIPAKLLLGCRWQPKFTIFWLHAPELPPYSFLSIQGNLYIASSFVENIIQRIRFMWIRQKNNLTWGRGADRVQKGRKWSRRLYRKRAGLNKSLGGRLTECAGNFVITPDYRGFEALFIVVPQAMA